MIEVVHYDPELFALAGVHQPVHKLEVREDELCVGYADLIYRRNPFPYFYIDFIEVKPSFRGLGYGSILVNTCNQFIRSNKKPGLLYNGIADNSPVSGLYERHGWTKLDAPARWYGLDIPDSFPNHKVIVAARKAYLSMLRS